MTTQNYQNHSRYPQNRNRFFPLFLLVLFLGAVLNILDPLALDGKLWSLLMAALCLGLIMMWYSIRSMVINVQDRAIRAEENFRHFILIGKPLPVELSRGQIVALRFASDTEMPELANRAVVEKLTRKSIKKAIQQWRPDLNRA